jgi:hypothetical protein
MRGLSKVEMERREGWEVDRSIVKKVVVEKGKERR